jgi:hypothetical protein
MRSSRKRSRAHPVPTAHRLLATKKSPKKSAIGRDARRRRDTRLTMTRRGSGRAWRD